MHYVLVEQQCVRIIPSQSHQLITPVSHSSPNHCPLDDKIQWRWGEASPAVVLFPHPEQQAPVGPRHPVQSSKLFGKQ